MREILTAVAVLGGIGAVLGVVLAAAAHLFDHGEADRLSALTAALPGANCGACGYPGCAACAQAILEGRASAAVCPVGKAPVAEKIREIMNT